MTFSLLPDCLASRLSSTLADVEEAVDRVEQRPGTMEELAAKERPARKDWDRAQGAMRWFRRRVRGVHAALGSSAGLRPDLFAGHRPTLAGFRVALGTKAVLVALRAQMASQLRALPPPLGFGPRSIRRRGRAGPAQHQAGPDPPAEVR